VVAKENNVSNRVMKVLESRLGVDLWIDDIATQAGLRPQQVTAAVSHLREKGL